MSQAVLGFFTYVDKMMHAAEKLKNAGFGDDIEVFSPIPIGHEVEHVLGEKKNPIKYFTFFGGWTGFFFGTLLALGTAALYILPRYGRPIWPVTPTVIITYENTILFAVYITLIGFLIMSRLPSYKERTYDARVNVDEFALLVKARQDKLAQVEQILKEAGAEEVKRVDEK